MITNRARESGPKEHRAKKKWQRETHSVTYVPGLFTLSNISRIDVQHLPSFLSNLLHSAMPMGTTLAAFPEFNIAATVFAPESHIFYS